MAKLELGDGTLAISPIPGRAGDFASDIAVWGAWEPHIVLTMTEQSELDERGGSDMADEMAAIGARWLHMPLPDFGAPDQQTEPAWPAISSEIRSVLAEGGRVIVHCFGGCGRSGMAVLRLMIELGEEPTAALDRLREVRPCAVETDPQMQWAFAAPPSSDPSS